MGQRFCLLGMMGSGKSTVGHALAQRLQVSFYDIDSYMEARLGESIATFMRREGETAFREVEHVVARELDCRVEEGIVATGGGFVTHPPNAVLFQGRHDRRIWLQRPLEDIIETIAQDVTRPLATTPKAIRELYQSREMLYAKAATDVIPPMPVDEAVAMLQMLWEKESRI